MPESRVTRINNMIVRVSPGRITPPAAPKFKAVLDDMVAEMDKKNVDVNKREITCATKEEATHDKRGFHSSGTGRKLKRQGYKIQTRQVSSRKFEVFVSRVA